MVRKVGKWGERADQVEGGGWGVRPGNVPNCTPERDPIDRSMLSVHNPVTTLDLCKEVAKGRGGDAEREHTEELNKRKRERGPAWVGMVRHK